MWPPRKKAACRCKRVAVRLSWVCTDGGCGQRFASQRLRVDSGSVASNPLSGQRFVAQRPWVVLQRFVACFAERFSVKMRGRDVFLTLPPEVACAIS